MLHSKQIMRSSAHGDRSVRVVERVYSMLWLLRSALVFHRLVLVLLIPLLVGFIPSAVEGASTGVTAARRAMVPNGRFISGWGAPRSGGRTHQGEDLAAPRGSAIYAPVQLKILNNGWNSLGGWTVFARDAKGRNWYFAHLNTRSAVRVGSTVAKGQRIGSVGTSGNASGTTPHLHYQVSYPNGNWGNPVHVLRAYPR